MSWAKFDDQYPDHPKIVEVGPLGLALHTAATCYCARYLTDGFIPAAMMGRLLNFDGINVNNSAVTNKQVTEELIRVGLLEVVPGGYQVHDYLEYNPPAAQVKAERAANKKRQEEYQARKKNNGVSNGVSNGANNTAPSPSPEENKEPPKTLADNFSVMLGVSWGDAAELEEAESICLEYPEAEVIAAAKWLREKHPRSMKSALSAMRSTLRDGTWNIPVKAKSNGHNGQSKSTITRNPDGTFNI